jgi:hypothetical protein
VTPLRLIRPLHDIPADASNRLPKFSGTGTLSAEEHIQNFYDALTLMDITIPDVIIRFFVDCALALEHDANAKNESMFEYQIGNYLTNWFVYAQIEINELRSQVGLIWQNLKLLYIVQQAGN